jgi:hypothetical protein
MYKYIFIKKVVGSKHPEVVSQFLNEINNIVEGPLSSLRSDGQSPSGSGVKKFSNIEKYYMIKIADEPMFRYLQENYTPETIYRNYRVKIYYFDRLFTTEFEDLDIPIFTLQHEEVEEPIYLESYRP